MTVDLRDKIYDSAETACRSAAAAWTGVYELAVHGNDKNIWVVEEAVWTAYVQACGVRNAAIEYRQESLAATRQRGRDAALARMLGPTAALAGAEDQPAAGDQPAGVPVAAGAALTETTSHLPEIPQAPPAAPPAAPPPAPPLSNAQSAWERAEAAALAADQGPNGAVR